MSKNPGTALFLKKRFQRSQLLILLVLFGSIGITACSPDDNPGQNSSGSELVQAIAENERRRPRNTPLPQNNNPDFNGTNRPGTADQGNLPPNGNNNGFTANGNLDSSLRNLIRINNLNANPERGRNLPSISSPLSQLGMQLFYSKSLGGGMDTACASCHHPSLGGGDDLALSIGVDAQNPDLLGLGRSLASDGPLVGRNAPTVFNSGLWDRGMFWDSRVESLGGEARRNGTASGISTPDSGFGAADLNAGSNLPAAQALFPVTAAAEMRSEDFEKGSSNEEIRRHLAARIGDYGEGSGELDPNLWLQSFQSAFDSRADAESLITFRNIAAAIAEFERSMVFVRNPWHAYVAGDNQALSDDAKRGAILFFSPPQNGGAGCSRCHRGPNLSDGLHHSIGFPQIGPGSGDGQTGDEDYGRERVTGNPGDRYRFRTASLLNVEMTAPFTHSGAYRTLEQVIAHYNNPEQSVNAYFRNGAWCAIPQFELIEDCERLYPNALQNSRKSLSKLQNDRRNGQSLLPRINLNRNEISDLAAFLRSLTDPCLKNRTCLSPWIPDDRSPDGNQLNAVNADGVFL
ncbi:MAG: cytochrome C peroxidase [SAR324 cluster bacterium]|nr:cytochrome C peroxidase [SAR324 cluster bacterium]